MFKRNWIVLGLACTWWACPRRPVDETLAPAAGFPDVPGPDSANRKVDILFVIDDSTSMASEQVRLGENLATLVKALERLEGGFPDVHIGVVSTDVGTGRWSVCAGAEAGRLRQRATQAGCEPPGDAYLEIENANGDLSGNVANVDTPADNGVGCQGRTDASGSPVPAASDRAIDACDVSAALRCIALIGDRGCNYEQPLEAARRALTCDGRVCPNPGFQRPDALLAVVFLGDQDDCSAADDGIFDPSADAALGPPGFRCFEQGIACDQAIDRTAAQTLTACRSNEASPYLTPVEEYYDFYSALRPTGRVVLAAISGPYAPGDAIRTQPATVGASCTGPGAADQAEPAVRIHELVRRFGDNGVVLADLADGGGICTDDFGPALDRVGEIIGEVFRQRCIPGPLASGADGGLDPIVSADDARCVVTEVRPSEDGEARVPIVRCAFADAVADACAAPDTSPGALAPGSPRPCWYVCDSTGLVSACPDAWELRVCRDASCDPTTPAPQGTVALAQCLTCAPADCSR